MRKGSSSMARAALRRQTRYQSAVGVESMHTGGGVPQEKFGNSAGLMAIQVRGEKVGAVLDGKAPVGHVFQLAGFNHGLLDAFKTTRQESGLLLVKLHLRK